MERALGERPVVASLRELDESPQVIEHQQWAVLHTVTEAGLQLIHWKPITSRQIAVRIEFPRHETLEIIVATNSSERHGPLYSTTARFHSLSA